MSTSITTIRTAVRNQLVEVTARFWTDAELNEITRKGAADLWTAILDLHGDHYFAITPQAYLRSGDTQISGLPTNLFRVQTIEPFNLTDTGYDVLFRPKPWKHPEFQAARALSSQDVSQGQIIYYALTGVGAPINAPTILTAPKINADLQLNIAYNPTLVWDANGDNPVPGESDQALVNWTVAYARAKDNEQRLPDPGWLTLYEREKQKILVSLTPRQEQEPEVVEDFFSGVYQEN